MTAMRRALPTTLALAALDAAAATGVAMVLEAVANERFVPSRALVFQSIFAEADGELAVVAAGLSAAVLVALLVLEPWLAWVWARRHLPRGVSPHGEVAGALRVASVHLLQAIGCALALLPLGLVGLGVHAAASHHVVAHDLALATLAVMYGGLVASASVAGWASTLAVARGEPLTACLARGLRAVTPRFVSARVLAGAVACLSGVLACRIEGSPATVVAATYGAAAIARLATSALLGSLAEATQTA